MTYWTNRGIDLPWSPVRVTIRLGVVVARRLGFFLLSCRIGPLMFRVRLQRSVTSLCVLQRFAGFDHAASLHAALNMLGNVLGVRIDAPFVCRFAP